MKLRVRTCMASERSARPAELFIAVGQGNKPSVPALRRGQPAPRRRGAAPPRPPQPPPLCAAGPAGPMPQPAVQTKPELVALSCSKCSAASRLAMNLMLQPPRMSCNFYSLSSGSTRARPATA